MDEREMYERAIEDLKRQLSEKDHQMTLYQTQLGVWMEDFKQERKDREKAQSKVIDLEKELILYKDLVSFIRTSLSYNYSMAFAVRSPSWSSGILFLE